MFDNICKFLAETFPTDFARWLLGEAIALSELSPSELSLEPIRADALILLQSEDIVTAPGIPNPAQARYPVSDAGLSSPSLPSFPPQTDASDRSLSTTKQFRASPANNLHS